VASVWEDLARQGWEFAENTEGAGYTKSLERNGFRLSYDGHWSVRQHFVSSEDGGWGDLQQIMSRVGLASQGNDEDLLTAAAHADAIKGYLDSWRWKVDVRAVRHEGMEKLREFQREQGMTESWLASEEDHLRQRAEWKGQLSGLRGIKYWGAAVVAGLYLVYWVATAENVMRGLMIVAIGFAILGSCLLALAFQKKI
jgi:hypothetical protein